MSKNYVNSKRRKYLDMVASVWISEHTKKPGERGIEFEERTMKRRKRKESFQTLLNNNNFESEAWFSKFVYEFKLEKLRGIKIKKNHPIKFWYLDYSYPALKIAIEIDGVTHDNEERKFKDKVKLGWLEQDGWTIFVIKHKDEQKALEVCNFLNQEKLKEPWKPIRSKGDYKRRY